MYKINVNYMYIIKEVTVLKIFSVMTVLSGDLGENKVILSKLDKIPFQYMFLGDL